MYLLPRIELRDGESSHGLVQPGQGEAESILRPAEVAKRFTALGAQGLHVVDVDHALSPSRNNDAHLVEIIDATWLPVQAGGGVRSLKRIQELLDTGCARVIVGTMGVLHQDWLKEAALCFPERLVAGLDARDGRLLVKGRTEESERTLESFAAEIDAYGLESIHIAALSAGRNGASIVSVADLARRLKTPVTVEGDLHSEADLRRLADAGVRGVSLGREIYDGTLRLDQLVKQYRVG